MLTVVARRYDVDALKERACLTDPELAARLPCGWCSPCRRGRAFACEHRGLSERQLLRKKSLGLTWLEADRYAAACGEHPALVWQGWDGDRDIEASG